MAIEAYPYAGGNEVIDRLHNNVTDLWIVNGAAGRRVMLMPIGSNKAEAIKAYKIRYDLLSKKERELWNIEESTSATPA